MFSSDEKEARVAEAKAATAKAFNDTLIARAEAWILSAPHRKGCMANIERANPDTGRWKRDETTCSCGRNALLLAFMDRRADGRPL